MLSFRLFFFCDLPIGDQLLCEPSILVINCTLTFLMVSRRCEGFLLDISLHELPVDAQLHGEFSYGAELFCELPRSGHLRCELCRCSVVLKKFLMVISCSENFLLLFS
jgi:hypothetical protein